MFVLFVCKQWNDRRKNTLGHRDTHYIFNNNVNFFFLYSPLKSSSILTALYIPYDHLTLNGCWGLSQERCTAVPSEGTIFPVSPVMAGSDIPRVWASTLDAGPMKFFLKALTSNLNATFGARLFTETKYLLYGYNFIFIYIFFF